MNEDNNNLIPDFCRRHWGKEPHELSFPGGKSRKTVFAKVGGSHVAISRRRSIGRARLEGMALRQLGVSGHVPTLLAQEGLFVVQDIVPGNRLTKELESASPARRQSLLFSAGKSLLELQKLGTSAGLLEHVPQIGIREGWAEDFAQTPVRVSKRIGVAAPSFDIAKVVSLLKKRSYVFVKWDARPGNANLALHDRVTWFDWEHCGGGSTEDDLVWLLADEWSPISSDAERELFDLAADLYGASRDEIAHRFYIKATLHSLVRLLLIFDRKGDGPWWPVRQSLEFDRVGVSVPHVTRQCRKGKTWADRTDEMRGLAPLFRAIENYASQLPG